MSGQEGPGWATVIVVDDQQPNVLLLERLLARIGAVGRVIGLTDPREAVKLCEEFEPDLVMLDLHMPHMDGLAVLTRLAALTPPDSYVPVIVLTADVTDEAKQRALGRGASDFLTKPFDQGEVTLRVGNLLRTRALHRELAQHNAKLRDELATREARDREEARERSERAGRIRSVLERGAIRMVYQPIIRLGTGTVAGFEALARFDAEPSRPPNEWFDEAEAVGMGVDLELAAISAALYSASPLPAGAYISLNASPRTLTDSRLTEILASSPCPVVVELTEHDAVDSYEELVDAVAELRRIGARVAIDDAGAGYASLRHILWLKPDIIKLDISLTRDIHLDPSRRALAASLVAFGRETGAEIVAEGIECHEELEALRALRVGCGQGFHLAVPGSLPQRAAAV